MRIVLEPERNLATFLAARLVFVAALLGVAALFHGTRGLTTYLLLFAANAGLSIGCWEWVRRSRVSTFLSGCAITGAVVLDTIVLRQTGGGDSEFIFLYFFSVGSAGMLIGLRGALWAAALSIIGTVWMFGGGQPGFLSEHGLRTFVYALNYILTAAIAAYAFDRIRTSEHEHQTALGELEQTKFDTQAILDSLSTGVLVTDSAGGILYSNPAGHHILGANPVTGTEDLQRLMKPDSAFGDAVKRLAEQSQQEMREETSLLVNGVTRPIGMSVSVLRDKEAKPRGLIVLFNDLTRIKERERAEREQERLAAIGRLSRDLAHEIRNPLATVRGCVEMIHMVEASTEEAKPYLNLALRESDRLNRLLQDFLTFADLRAPNRTSCDLAQLVRERCSGLSVPLRESPEIPPSMLLDADPDQLSLALDAILLTLSEWGEKAPVEIVMRASPRPTAFLGLSDVTVPAEICTEAFRPFSGVNKSSGSLLLPTAWRVVQGHGGCLSLRSDKSEGTWFELTL